MLKGRQQRTRTAVERITSIAVNHSRRRSERSQFRSIGSEFRPNAGLRPVRFGFRQSCLLSSSSECPVGEVCRRAGGHFSGIQSTGSESGICPVGATRPDNAQYGDGSGKFW